MRKGGKILLKKRIDRSRMSIQHQKKGNDVKKDWEPFSVKQQKNAGSAMQLNVSDYKYNYMGAAGLLPRFQLLCRFYNTYNLYYLLQADNTIITTVSKSLESQHGALKIINLGLSKRSSK